MHLRDLSSEIDSLQLQIDDNEKNFDIAILDFSKLAHARQIYLNIKLLEERLAGLKILLKQKLELK